MSCRPQDLFLAKFHFALVRVAAAGPAAESSWVALHELDFGIRQAVEIIDQRVDLLVGGGDGVPQRLPLRLDSTRPSGDGA